MEHPVGVSIHDERGMPQSIQQNDISRLRSDPGEFQQLFAKEGGGDRSHPFDVSSVPALKPADEDFEATVRLMREVGFSRVEYRNLSGGIVAIHIAVK